MEEKDRKFVLWKLFISTLYLSTFTFGGGYVIVTLMKKKFVDEYHWIKEEEMLDLVAIAQSSPGAIAVNGAIVVGYKLVGISGAMVAILGTILPPFLILSIVSMFYQAFRSNWFISWMLEGMQAGVGAVIVSVTIDMGIPIVKEKDIVSLLIMMLVFVASYIFGVNVVYIVLACGAFGTIRTLLCTRSFVQIGLFSFGGGYAAMPLIQGQVVTAHGWLSIAEFTDLITISQMTPGPIAVNSATFVGLKIAGVPGAIVATLGCILPSCIIVTLLAKLYLKYRKLDILQGILHSLRPGVVAMIASSGAFILVNAFFGGKQGILLQTKWEMVAIFIVALLLLRKTKINPISVMLIAGVLRVVSSIF